MPDPLLSIRGVTIRFGGIVALDRVSFDVPEHSVVGLIGPNGAGKTTMFNCITRLYNPNEGEILYEDRNLLHDAAHTIVRRGIARTFQNVELFPRMTVLQNVMVGDHINLGSGALHPLKSAVAWPSTIRSERDGTRRALDALEFVGLQDLAGRVVGGLSFGTLKAVELARALVSRPRLLLLDEPAGGLSHDELAGLVDLLKRIHQEMHLTLLVVEHHMSLVMRVSHRVVCLDFGRKIADDTPAVVQSDPAVIEAYLGTAEPGIA